MPAERKQLLAHVVTPGGDNPLTLKLGVAGAVRRGIPAPQIFLLGRGGTPPYAFSIIGGSLPPGLTLNSTTGKISGTPTTIGRFPFIAEVQDFAADVFPHSFSIDVVSRLVGLNVKPNAGERGQFYSYTFRVSNATGAVTWTLGTGNFPDGLGISTAGVLSGTPTNLAVGMSYYSVIATDAGSGDTLEIECAHLIYQQLTVVGGSPVIAPNPVLGLPYSFQIPAIDGFPPYTFTVATNNLPPGISISSTGLVSGIPTGQSTGATSINVTDPIRGLNYVNVVMPLHVVDPNDKIQPKENGVNKGPAGPSVYDFVDGVNTTANVVPSTGKVTVSFDASPPSGGVTDINGQMGSVSLISADGTVVIEEDSSGAIDLSVLTESTATLSRYEFEFLGASAGAERYNYMPATFKVTGAVLLAQPSGSCVVDIWVDGYSAFPPTIGDSICAAAKPTISSGVKAKDTTLTGWTTLLAADSTITAHLDSLTTATNVKLVLYGFQPNQAITSITLSGTLPNGTIGVSYSHSLPITGGIPPYLNPVFSPTLPAGLSAAVVSTDVVVSGTPTTGAAYSGTATVDDSFGQTSNALPLSFSIPYATLTLTGTYPASTTGVPYSQALTIAGGDGTYTLTGGTGLISGTLPPGLALSIVGSTLVLSGTTTTPGTYSFTVGVDSGDGQSATSPQSVTDSASSYATWNSADAAGTIVLSNSDMRADGTGAPSYRSVRSTNSVSGKQYFELLINVALTGGNSAACGVSDGSQGLIAPDYCGSTTLSTGFWIDPGNVYSNGSVIGSLGAQSVGVTRSEWAVDSATRNVWVRLHGGAWLGGGDPALGTSPTATLTGSGGIFAMATPYTPGEWTDLVSDPANMTGTPPSGFTPIL